MKNSILTKVSALLITVLGWSAISQAGPEDIKEVLSCRANVLSIRSIEIYKNWATDQMFMLINNAYDKFFFQESDFKSGLIPFRNSQGLDLVLRNQSVVLIDSNQSSDLMDSGWEIVSQGRQVENVYPLECK